MEASQAETTVTLAAALSAGIYFYRRAVEPKNAAGETITSEDLHSIHAVETFKRMMGSGPILPLGQWLPAAGVTYIGLAIVTAISPQVGGAGALLVGAGTLIGNGLALQKDLAVQKGAAEQPSVKQLLSATPSNPTGGVHPAVMHSPPAPIIERVNT